MLVLEEAVEAGPRKEPMESSKKLLLLPLTLALLVGCILLDNGLLEEKENIILSALHIGGIYQFFRPVDSLAPTVNSPDRKLVNFTSVHSDIGQQESKACLLKEMSHNSAKV